MSSKSKTQIINKNDIGPELKTEGRCYCRCWKCSSLIVTFDKTPVSTPTTSIVEKYDTDNYNADDESNTLNNTTLSEFSSPDLKHELMKINVEPLVHEPIFEEPVIEEPIKEMNIKSNKTIHFLKNWTIDINKVPKYASFKCDIELELDYKLLKLMYESNDPCYTEDRKKLLLPIINKIDQETNKLNS